MLALTDSQLALLAIAATAVAPHKRAAWLGAARGEARPASDALGRPVIPLRVVFIDD
jgi:hypothetical protein